MSRIALSDLLIVLMVVLTIGVFILAKLLDRRARKRRRSSKNKIATPPYFWNGPSTRK
jgi:hypothetical protein